MALPPKFTNVQPLTPGRNARVFKALNSFVGREVFLKIYPVPSEDSQSALREPQLLRQLEHQNLVKIFGADAVNNGSILLEMELVSGGSFQDIIDTAASTGTWPSVHECIRLTLEAAAGLSHLHSRGYVHRDIKPANLIVRNAGARRQGVVTDLGLASKLNQSGRAFASQHARLYRPPEVWDGTGYSVSSDIYQLGIVLFQLLGGTLDYSLSNLPDDELKKKAIDGTLVDLESIGPHVAECLRRVLRKCVCLEAERLPCVSDFVVALNAAKVNHADWKCIVRPGGFDMERVDDSGAVYRVEVAVEGSNHTVMRRKRSAVGKFRAHGKAETFQHRDIGRCQKFRQIVIW
jgi:eukaryotic-like serine/threonine-protein kinase